MSINSGLAVLWGSPGEVSVLLEESGGCHEKRIKVPHPSLNHLAPDNHPKFQTQSSGFSAFGTEG